MFQSCKIWMICKISNQDRLVLRNPVLCCLFGLAGHYVDFDLKVMCLMSVIYLVAKILCLLIFSEK